MTKMQAKIVEKIKAYVLEHDCFNSDYEIKRFDVDQIKLGLVRVYSIAGRKNDENSILRTLCRTRRKLVIGPLGGITAYVNAGEKKKVFRGWNKAIILGYDKQPHNFPTND
jgi:hypothetical protein